MDDVLCKTVRRTEKEVTYHPEVSDRPLPGPQEERNRRQQEKVSRYVDGMSVGGAWGGEPFPGMCGEDTASLPIGTWSSVREEPVVAGSP